MYDIIRTQQKMTRKFEIELLDLELDAEQLIDRLIESGFPPRRAAYVSVNTDSRRKV